MQPLIDDLLHVDTPALPPLFQVITLPPHGPALVDMVASLSVAKRVLVDDNIVGVA